MSGKELSEGEKTKKPVVPAEKSSIVGSSAQLLICVGGIYASFLTWAVLQERISTTPYGPDNQIFRASLVINTVQSILASIVGYIYLSVKRSTGDERSKAPVFGSIGVIQQYLLVAIAQSLSSPFAYASLKYVDYLTLLLAKSCKLIPVMALHLVLYRRTFPLYKYLVVFAITAGVSMFTLFHTKPKKDTGAEASFYGFFILGINLFLDGFYNTTQDNMFHTYKSITGPHMMAGLNAISTLLTSVFLLTPFTSQLSDAMNFIAMHPAVLRDILLFGICGALGQVFIFYTLEKYGSVLLVTVTVTRKMFSMLLSVLWFNHSLSLGQWVGVVTVFAGIGAESYIKFRQAKSKVE